MPPKSIIIDCDPGQDDAVMLLLALASPEELKICGISTVAGNVPLELTQRNARVICELAGRSDVSVYAGCKRPLVRPPITAEKIHGNTGIDGFNVFEPTVSLEEIHGVDFIIDTLMAAADGEITLVLTGPHTNVAVAMVKEPGIVPKIAQIVIMGGALRERGNTQPSAEFNILADPHSAHVVFSSGCHIVAIGLDVTHKTVATPERMKMFEHIPGKIGQAVHSMLTFYDRKDPEKYGSSGSPLHDPCTIAYLLEPQLFTTKFVNVEIEIQSELTMGETVVDFWGVTGRRPNIHWAHQIDHDQFYSLLVRRIAQLPG